MKAKRVWSWATLAATLFSMAVTMPALASDVLYDTQPGSFLVFPLFDIQEGNSTQIRITNIHKSSSVRVQLNVVCPGTKADNFCDALDVHIALTPYETKVIKVDGLNPPCKEGFIAAFAENANHEAVAWNHLIGSYHIDYGPGGYEAEQAIAIQSVKDDEAVLGADGELQFGPGKPDSDQDYAGLGTKLYTDFLSVDHDRGSELVLLTLDTVAGAHNPTTHVGIKFFNEKEVPFSTSWQYVCWTRVPLDAIDFNFQHDNLGTTYGSMEITPEASCPIAGGCPPLEEFEPAILGAINEYRPGSSTKRNLFHDRETRSTVFAPR
jgi:hypothetical protein